MGIPWLFAGLGLWFVWTRREKAARKWGLLRTTLSLFGGFWGGILIGNLVSFLLLITIYGMDNLFSF